MRKATGDRKEWQLHHPTLQLAQRHGSMKMSLHPRTPAPEAWRLAQHRETTATGAADFTCRKQGNGTTFIEHALGGEQQQALT